MWTKFVKITPFKTLFFLLLLLTLIPSGSQAQIQMAAAAEAEQAAAVQTADDAKNSIDIFADDIKPEKKDKDKIQLNFNFFLSNYQPHLLPQLQKAGYCFYLCTV